MRVRFVVIGGIAAQLHDLAVLATIDIDVTPARDNKNLQRLAKAFDVLEGGLGTANDAGSWLSRHPVTNWAHYDPLHLTTKHGPIEQLYDSSSIR